MPAARIQPQGRSQPSRAPINKALAFLWNAAQPERELLSGTGRTTDNTAKVAAPVGKVISASAGQVNIEWSRQFITTSSGDGLGDFTLAVYANPAASGSAVEHIFAQKNDAGGAPYAQSAILAHANSSAGFSSGAVSFFTYNGAGADAGVSVAGAADGKYHWWVGVRRGSVHELYKDGVLIGTFTKSPVAITQAGTTRYTAIGSRGNGNTESYTKQAALAAGWNRALSPAETGGNPWQLFEAQAPLLFVASAPASGVTASPSGVSASSAVGSATATGQAKASPTGVSAASSVGAATVSGQGKASPAGVSAASAVGTATASGAASSTAQPAGVSAAASVGAAVATGQAKAAPAGVSTSSAVGTATATGQAITTAYPAGVQVVAAVGSATARGTATAAPLGVSSSIYVGTAYAYGPFDISSYPKLYATTLMRLDTVNRQGGTLRAMLARQSAIRATEAAGSLMRAQPINLTSAMRSDPINRTAGLL